MGPRLNSADDLTGFPNFPIEQRGSLLYKHLDENVWEELKDRKDAAGFGFRQAIFVGCKNPDAGIGVIAGSHDSYTTFAALFDQIV